MMNTRYNRYNMVTYTINKIECIKQMGVYFNAILSFITQFTLKVLFY